LNRGNSACWPVRYTNIQDEIVYVYETSHLPPEVR